MIYDIPESEIRNLCREKIESLEHWLRRLIDDILTAEFGDYFSHVNDNGDRLISNKIVQPLEKRVNSNPEKYQRRVDAILLDDSINIICNPRLYFYFKSALILAFPDGNNEASTFMGRLIEPRNNLSHANAITARQAEQVICYSNDIIDSIRHYYKEAGMQQEYDVPLILKFTDSFGNVMHRNQMQGVHDGGIMKQFDADPNFSLRPGDELSIEIEIDPAYGKDEYNIEWASTKNLAGVELSKPKLALKVGMQHVGQKFILQCRITTKREWHRMQIGVDDFLMIVYKVLPPLS